MQMVLFQILGFLCILTYINNRKYIKIGCNQLLFQLHIKYGKWLKIDADEYFLCIGYVCWNFLHFIHFSCLQSSSDFHCVIVLKHTVNLLSIQFYLNILAVVEKIPIPPFTRDGITKLRTAWCLPVQASNIKLVSHISPFCRKVHYLSHVYVYHYILSRLLILCVVAGEFTTQTCFQGRFGDEVGSDQFGAQIMFHAPFPDQQLVVGKLSYIEVTYAGQAFRYAT